VAAPCRRHWRCRSGEARWIEAGKPEQNGRHERMHKTLKDETTIPPAHSLQAQQRKFDRFRGESNDERPHEALDMTPPAGWYQPSRRSMPDRLLEPEYPDRFEVRLVSGNGGVRWHQHWVNVTSVLVGENIGFEEVADGLWNVYFGPVRLGRFHERLLKIEDSLGKLKRRVCFCHLSARSLGRCGFHFCALANS
jgi:putative transposase